MEIADFVIHVHTDLPAPERDKLAAEIGEHDGVIASCSSSRTTPR